MGEQRQPPISDDELATMQQEWRIHYARDLLTEIAQLREENTAMRNEFRHISEVALAGIDTLHAQGANATPLHQVLVISVQWEANEMQDEQATP